MAKVFTLLYPFSASMSGIKKTGGGFQESLLKISSMICMLDGMRASPVSNNKVFENLSLFYDF